MESQTYSTGGGGGRRGADTARADFYFQDLFDIQLIPTKFGDF